MNFLFDLPQPTINKKIRFLEFFAGIGATAKALENLGVDFEHYFVCEFDKYAMASYNAIHNTNFETTDIREIHGKDLKIVDKDKYSYILTYSWPCTSLSVAGKMEGMKEGSGTASSLLFEVKRIFTELSDDELPDILCWENVPQVHSEQNMPELQKWLDYLKSRGYFTYYEDLNAKDFGIPQNRERCFGVSILSKEFVDFEFPKKIPLQYVMKDFLQTDVDEKYFIRSEKADKLIEQLIKDGKLD